MNEDNSDSIDSKTILFCNEHSFRIGNLLRRMEGGTELPKFCTSREEMLELQVFYDKIVWL